MQKQPIRKAIALFLIAGLLLGVLPGSWAVDEVPVQASQNELELTETTQEFAKVTENAGTIAPLDANTVPEIIGYEEACRQNHILRLYNEEGEDLNKVIFLNADGTRTMYIYDFPVKYIDSAGIVQDKSLEIATAESGFCTASGDAVTTFAAKLSDGISLSGNGVSLRLVPMTTNAPPLTGSVTADDTVQLVGSQQAQRIDSNTVRYVYDSKTTLEYSLTYTGFKEDIVVSQYTGQTEYDFLLYTNGYALQEMHGSYFLVDEEGNIKATIGDIIIFTADERNNTFGQIVPTTIVENEQYLLTIVVDADFLADEKTAYPIRIDPTVEIFYAEENEGDLEDVTVSDTTTYSGTSGSLYIGNKEGAGICRALMKFPIVEDLPDNIIIQSAHIKVRDLMCQGTAMNIECYVFRGNDWSESTATWTNTNAGSSSSIGEHLCTVVMDYDIGVTYLAKHWYTFDITSAVQGWCDGTYSLDAGIIFKMPTADENGSAYLNRTIGSYNRSENQPLGEITYIVDGGIVEVRENSTTTLSVSGTSGTVTSWVSSDTNIAEVNPSGVVSGRRAGVTTISAYVGTDLQKTYTVRVVLEDGVYGIGSSIENLYMAVSVMSMADGTTVELKNLQSDMPNKLQQFWKIQYLGGGKYCIRPMHKLNMALSTSSFKVNISDAGTGSSLSLVAAKDQWTITYKNNGYVFMRSGLINYTLTHKEENNKRQVTYAQYVETDPAFYWTITELHFPPSGILFYNKDTYELINEFSSHVVLGKEKTLDQLGIVVAVYSGETNSQEVSWSSSDADIASVQSATGTVSGNASGNVDITACSSAAGASGSYPLLVLTNENSYGFTSYYDKGFHMIDVADITKAVRFVDAAYYKHFGIGFGTEEPIYYGGFLADRCGITTNLPCDERCLSADSGSCCENSHHKNVH